MVHSLLETKVATKLIYLTLYWMGPVYYMFNLFFQKTILIMRIAYRLTGA